ncbi:MAG TPA: NAD(P)H-binding protein [Gaiella sp.]|jgi:NADH dehydrogenase|nr:NAD(P)H-binding protein [Gaiella sp.]
MILVTGATGFVGGHVVAALRSARKQVRCLVRDLRTAAKPELAGCELVVGDMTEPASLASATEGVECVVHLVAIRQGRAEQFERIMSQGTRDLLRAAQDAGVRRFVHMSALGLDERTKDLVPYYRAKWSMEQAVEGSTIPFVIFRPSFVFAVDGGILPTFRKLARLAPVTPIAGPGKQRLQPIWADDVAAYFVRAVDEEAATGGTFELGGPDVVSWNELWAKLKQAIGVRRPSVHVPMAFMRANALVTERLPGNIPLTRDLLTMMEAGDNVVTDGSAERVFQLPLVSLEEQLHRAA